MYCSYALFSIWLRFSIPDSTFDVCLLDNNPVHGFHSANDLEAGKPFEGKFLLMHNYGDRVLCPRMVDDTEYCSTFQGDLALGYTYKFSDECLLGDEVVSLPFVIYVYCRDHLLTWLEIYKTL